MLHCATYIWWSFSHDQSLFPKINKWSQINKVMTETGNKYYVNRRQGEESK
jgi:hypothetical protein